MRDRINRRRFVACSGAAGIVGVTGCVGLGEEPGEEGGQSEASSSSDGEHEPREQPDGFDFPPGADESGIVTETVVAGGRQFIDERDRYRTAQRYELDPSDAPTDEIEITYDVDGLLVHERETRNGVEINRWRTPERTVARSVDSDADRTGQWESRTAESTSPYGNALDRYPFEETAIPALLESAALEFDGIVTESEQPYARYTGEITRAEPPVLRRPNSARVEYRLESISGGNVAMLLAESGAIRSVEYELSGDGVRRTHDGPEEVGIGTSGELDFEYDEGLETLSAPEWAETPDPSATRRFEIAETSLGETYSLASGPSLPGSVEQEYAEFYITAQFGSERYMDRYRPRREFDTRDGLLAWLEDGELHLDWSSFSGQDAFVAADRIEMSIYLYAPEKGRSLIFHEVRSPE